MAEISSESQFFSGYIANMIPEGPLSKMVPLTEDHGGGGGGVHGDPRQLTDYVFFTPECLIKETVAVPLFLF